MNPIDITNVIFGFIGVVGTVIGVLSYVRARKMSIEKLRFSWSDLVSGSQAISKRGIKKFKPSAILTFSGSGAVFGNLALIFSDEYLPIYTVVEFPANKEVLSNNMRGFVKLRTSKWLLCIPEAFLVHSKERVLVVHDSAISGTGLATIRQGLIDLGFVRSNIFVACFVCTKAALDANLAPDFYSYSLDNTTFYYPWGERI